MLNLLPPPIKLALLTKVEYLFYEWEQAYFFENESQKIDWHAVDGQICLIFANSLPIFISWFNGVAQYCIEMSEEPFVQKPNMKNSDLSTHLFWAPFIEKQIEFEFLDDDHQTLRLFCSDSKNELFLSSQYEDGCFYGDCLRISNHIF